MQWYNNNHIGFTPVMGRVDTEQRFKKILYIYLNLGPDLAFPPPGERKILPPSKKKTVLL